jgi:hypothetical protein
MKIAIVSVVLAGGGLVAATLIMLGMRDGADGSPPIAAVRTASPSTASPATATLAPPTALPSPSGPPPDLALAYSTLGGGTRSVVVLDARSFAEYARFNLPEGIYLHRLRPNGELLYFVPEDAAINRFGVGTPHRLIALNIFTGLEREILTVDRYVDFGFALSPEGHSLAYSVRIADANSGVADIEIRLLDLITLEDRAVGTFGGEPFEQFSGSATVRAWRDDGSLSIVGAKQGGQPTGYAMLNMATGARVFNEPGWAILSPRGRWLVYADSNGVGSIVRHPQRVRIIEPLTNVEVNRFEDAGQCSVPLEWSPDESELLITQRAPASPDRNAPPGCDETQVTYWLMRADGSPPTPVADLLGLWRRWYGERLVEVRCPPRLSGVREGSCSDSTLVLNGREVASERHIDVLGWIEP